MRHVVLDTNALIADYIVTEDSHFDRLKKIPFPQQNVLTLDEFNETLTT